MTRLATYRSNLKSISNYNNVENFVKKQFGFLGQPLVVSETILEAIIVHHMNSDNVNYLRNAPKIPEGAPMADFIYNDIYLRSEEIIQRYLCGEDEILESSSQMGRMILKHLKKYHSLLKSTSKEAKLALNKERKRTMKFTEASSNLTLSNVSNMIALKKEIEQKQRDLIKVKNDTRKKARLTDILNKLQRRKQEVQAQLKQVPPEKRSRAASELLKDTGQINISKLSTQIFERLNPSTQALVSPVYKLKSGSSVFNVAPSGNYSCSSYPLITDGNAAHLVFSSYPVNPQLASQTIQLNNLKPFTEVVQNPTQNLAYFALQCEDMRVSSVNAADLRAWKSDPNATDFVPIKGVMESFARKLIPFRTVFGDRLVKRRIVLHSFVERLNAALYINYTRNNTRSELHPLYQRFSGLFLDNFLNSNSNFNERPKYNLDSKVLLKYGAVQKSTGNATGNEIKIQNNLNDDQIRRLIYELQIPKEKFQGKSLTQNITFRQPGTKEFSELSDWEKKASSRLFYIAGSASNVGNVNTNSDDLLWNEKLRSFGTNGPQDYWIQLVREMYDSRRVENIRKKLRTSDNRSRKDEPLTPEEISTKFQNLKLGDNLGVTCYGYTCDPSDPTAPWSQSYHRFGRAWFCGDVNGDKYQLPFGCYSDRCAPPIRGMSHPDYHSKNSGTHPARIKGDLETIAVNNICTTVLQSDVKFGTQGRFGHIKTAYRGQRIGKMIPSEAFDVFKKVRQANDEQNMSTTSPFKITIGRKLNNTNTFNNSERHAVGTGKFIMNWTTGPELKWSILNARGAVTLPISSPIQNLTPPTEYAKYTNLKNIIANQRNTNIVYNVGKLKNTNGRGKELIKYFSGQQTNWNAAKHGDARVTGYNLKEDVLENLGAGLQRDSRKLTIDTQTLDENFMMIDGDIFTGCNTKDDSLLYGGSEKALGISKKFVDGLPVIPLILPLNVNHDSYPQIRKRSHNMFNMLVSDSTDGLKGIVKRQMENVCIPIFKSGSLLMGTHFNDLMTRFLDATKDIEDKGEILEEKLQSPRLINVVKCIQFYLYVHVGLEPQEALTEIAKYTSRRNAKSLQLDIFTVSRKLRLLANTGPMPEKQFKKIVRQYLLTSDKKPYLQRQEVEEEIRKLTKKLSSFKIFGKEFARQSFLPSFLGGTQRANRKMGIPNKGFDKKLTGTGTAFEDMIASARRPLTTLKGLTKTRGGRLGAVIDS